MKRRLINAAIAAVKWLCLPSVTRWELIGLLAALSLRMGGAGLLECIGVFLAWWFTGRIMRPTAEALVPIGEWFDDYEPYNGRLWVSHYDPETRAWVESKPLDCTVMRPKKEGDQ